MVNRLAARAVAVALAVFMLWLVVEPNQATRAVQPRRDAAPPIDLRAKNLLTNPTFEEGFSLHGAQELLVANGWTPWFDERQARPEFKDEPYARYRPDGGVESFSFRVFHGAFVQKFFTFSGTHDAGFYQQARVPAAAPLQFSIWVQTWSSDCDDPCVSPREPCRFDSSNTHGTYRVQVGIDPTGAIPERLGKLPPDTVRWSHEVVFEAYDRWAQIQVGIPPAGMEGTETVTVYTRGSPVWPVKHNDSYWDDARLEVVQKEPPPTPDPIPTEPTQPPSATATRPANLTAVIHLPVGLKNERLDRPDAPTATLVAPTSIPTTLPPTATAPPADTPTGTPPPAASATPTPEVTEPGGTPTPTPEVTEPAATATALPTRTPLPPPAGCVNPVVNGDFETGDLAGWQAGPDGPAMPVASGAEVGPAGGDYSLRVGLTAATLDLTPSWAWALQTVSVPTGIATATLKVDVRPVSLETGAGDWQMVALRDAQGAPLKLVYWQPGRAAPGWATVVLPLDATLIAGRTVHLLAETYNDGDGASSALYVDNVRLVGCPPRVGASAADDGSDALPDQADIRIDYPIRAYPGQANFNLPNTCGELDFESVLIRNAGPEAVTVDGWTLEDLEGNRFLFPPFNLGPGHLTRVWTKSAPDVTDGAFTDLYWNRAEPVWNNPQNSTPWDVAVVKDAAGTERARRGYP